MSEEKLLTTIEALMKDLEEVKARMEKKEEKKSKKTSKKAGKKTGKK